jgi:hypothetical protein
MKRRIVTFVATLVLVVGLGAIPAGADAGGGPGSNHGCPGHQPPPPPHGGCGK